MSAEDALKRYYERLSKKSRKTTPNLKPEKEVERYCLEWMRSRGWSVDIYESKAVYNHKVGRFIKGSMKAGTVDCQGLTPDGTFIAVEFKALGRISTFNQSKNFRQQQYLREKINSCAFGCVVDSVARLERIYNGYIAISDKTLQKQFLLSMLPK